MLTQLTVDSLWNGEPLPDRECATVTLAPSPDGGVVVTVEGPDHGDPPPPCPPGSTERLWEHEVVELFIAGSDGHYLELELGPKGHYLVLVFDGVRHAIQVGLPLEYQVSQSGYGRFRGEARVPAPYLPAPPWRANAYLVHAGNGCGGESVRCHHAHAPVTGAEPDFHQPDAFVSLPPTLWGERSSGHG